MPTLPPKPPKLEISLTRKILVGGFIIGFWVFFYWYNGAYDKPVESENQQETSVESKGP